MKRLLIVLLFAAGTLTLRAVDISKSDEGFPFGIVNDADIANLMSFAKNGAVDLSKDLELAYKKDDAALSRVFLFSLKFEALDDNARTYGQIIWSSMLNLAEGRGTDWYFALVAHQPQDVRQRIRDFLHYATVKEGPAHEKDMSAEERTEWEKLFPKDYLFGVGDVIFKNQANQSSVPTLASGTSPAGQEPRHR